eukprot:scaffold456_cov368-Pavlova_lutheri.AAC.15
MDQRKASLVELSRQTLDHAATSRGRKLQEDVQNLRVLHITLEYAVPSVGINASFAGMGTIVRALDASCTQFRKGICGPLYSGCDPQLLGDADLEFQVLAFGKKEKVKVYKLDDTTRQSTYHLVSHPIFTSRSKYDMYMYADETEMLTFLSIHNQAATEVAAHYGYTLLHLHDYHAGLVPWLMYPVIVPSLVLTVHNADYTGTFPAITKSQVAQLCEAFGVSEQMLLPLCFEGGFSLLRCILHYRNVDPPTSALEIIMLNEAYAKRVLAVSDIFYDVQEPLLSESKESYRTISNGLDQSRGNFVDLDLRELFELKSSKKLEFQRKWGLEVNQQAVLMVFFSRASEQKGIDVLIYAAARLIEKYGTMVQFALFGPKTDYVAVEAEKYFCSLPARIKKQILCHLVFVSTNKEDLMLAANFFLFPSRFEPFGLADVEFAWHGTPTVGHETGGIGKTPGIYYKTMGRNDLDHSMDLERAMEEAVELVAKYPQKYRQMVHDSRCYFLDNNNWVREYTEAYIASASRNVMCLQACAVGINESPRERAILSSSQCTVERTKALYLSGFSTEKGSNYPQIYEFCLMLIGSMKALPILALLLNVIFFRSTIASLGVAIESVAASQLSQSAASFLASFTVLNIYPLFSVLLGSLSLAIAFLLLLVPVTNMNPYIVGALMGLLTSMVSTGVTPFVSFEKRKVQNRSKMLVSSFSSAAEAILSLVTIVGVKYFLWEYAAGFAFLTLQLLAYVLWVLPRQYHSIKLNHKDVLRRSILRKSAFLPLLLYIICSSISQWLLYYGGAEFFSDNGVFTLFLSFSAGAAASGCLAFATKLVEMFRPLPQKLRLLALERWLLLLVPGFVGPSLLILSSKQSENVGFLCYAVAGMCSTFRSIGIGLTWSRLFHREALIGSAGIAGTTQVATAICLFVMGELPNRYKLEDTVKLLRVSGYTALSLECVTLCLAVVVGLLLRKQAVDRL